MEEQGGDGMMFLNSSYVARLWWCNRIFSDSGFVDFSISVLNVWVHLQGHVAQHQNKCLSSW